ncbi:MAG: GCN5-related N-acetyltransferase [Frankiales bacterium]|nr:GCN5-related N-acetyltransferase [Frankiales bacterium]
MKDVLPSRSSSTGTRTCRPVRDTDELAVHHRIRRHVFVEEQGLFPDDDRDVHDDDPATVHVLGLVDGQPAGTVRLYPLAGELWKGDRLAVLAEQRHSGIGGPLVRFAVATAAERGGRRMDATVQAVNTAFFVGLGWTPVGEPVEHLGVPHQAMTIGF